MQAYDRVKDLIMRLGGILDRDPILQGTEIISKLGQERVNEEE